MKTVDLDQFEGMTPGPWEYVESIRRDRSALIQATTYRGTYWAIADIIPGNDKPSDPCPQTQANARAIAALPDLIAELREARERIAELEAIKPRKVERPETDAALDGFED